MVVGGGGREHAMCRALSAEPGVTVLAAPGNPGMADLARRVPLDVTDVAGIVDHARSEGADLVVPGPELPLVAGLGDALAGAGIPCCGPLAAAARLEGSKAFSRTLTADAGVPGPGYRVVEHPRDIESALAAFEVPPVVKADGLAAGKGVTLPDTMEECERDILALLEGRLGQAGNRVVLEQRLTGIEASLFYACRGTDFVAMPHARDHKRLEDGDLGPNTGGMGAISPNPVIDPGLDGLVADMIVAPTLQALARRGAPFSGFLFAGVMLTGDGPRLLEYNVRLGDPEAQAVLPRLDAGELLEVCRWVARLRSDPPPLRIDRRATCAVVAASRGYPESPRTGELVAIDPMLETPDRWFIHSGTAFQDGALVTAGGRVGAVVAREATAAEARASAYRGVSLVTFPGMTFRRDIGVDG
jgi:phosphoribosylamine--glycine ligase